MNSHLQEDAFGSQQISLPFLEVWTPDGNIRRFALGTKAQFAVERINTRISDPNMKVVFIVAIKDGEESVEFGPHADLASYGEGWRLQAIPDQRHCKHGMENQIGERRSSEIDEDRLYIIHRRNQINWENISAATRSNRSSGSGPTQRRDELTVRENFAARNSTVGGIYDPSSSSSNSRYDSTRSAISRYYLEDPSNF